METYVQLTEPAERHLLDRGWRERLQETPLGAWVQVGDRVALSLNGDPHDDLVVLQRRIVSENGELRLELLLHHDAADDGD